jgi:hypothetical protein
MKAAGITGTMDTLRAHAYLHLLSGQPASTLLDPAPRPATPGAGLRGTVNLTMPLAAWLGWTDSPGDVPGFGPLDAADSRTLAGLLAQGPGSQWCVTLTSPAGHPVAHACGSRGPGARPDRVTPASAGAPACSGTPPGAETRASPGPTPGPATRASPGDGRRDSGPCRDGPAAARPPATGPPEWLRRLTFTTLQTRDCTHPRQSRGYRPSPALRHLIEIRNPACTAPGCRRAATRCDLDHVTPYDRGGRTCECNLGPACRHDHQTKQTPGWTLTTPTPGTLIWTTPGNRTHTTTPAHYPE